MPQAQHPLYIEIVSTQLGPSTLNSFSAQPLDQSTPVKKWKNLQGPEHCEIDFTVYLY